MANIIVNSFPTNNTEQLRYALPENIHPYSTLTSSTEIPQGQVKMNFHIDRSETNDPPFGTHIHEAVEIVKDWMQKR
jgi:hypothetical protein